MKKRVREFVGSGQRKESGGPKFGMGFLREWAGGYLAPQIVIKWPCLQIENG